MLKTNVFDASIWKHIHFLGCKLDEAGLPLQITPFNREFIIAAVSGMVIDFKSR